MGKCGKKNLMGGKLLGRILLLPLQFVQYVVANLSAYKEKSSDLIQDDQQSAHQSYGFGGKGFLSFPN